MGSFDVACGLSNLTIHCGDAAVFIPLIPNLDNELPVVDPCHYLCSNEGPCQMYSPVTFPMYGTYDDYGRLELEESLGRTSFEKYFGIEIPRTDCIEGGAVEPLFDLPEMVNPEYMRLAGFTYEKQRWTYPGTDFTVRLAHPPKKDQKEHPSLYDPRLTKTLIYDGSGKEVDELGYYTWREGRVFVTRFGQFSGVYPTFGDREAFLKKLLRSFGGMFVLREVWDAMLTWNTQEMWNLEGRIENSYTALKKLITPVDPDDWKAVDDLTFRKSDYERQVMLGSQHHSFKATDILKGLHGHPDLFSENEKITRLIVSMLHVNRIFMPTNNGCQHGDDEMSLRLAEVYAGVCKRRLDDQED